MNDTRSRNIFSSASMHGKGIFSTVRITHGSPFLWEKHWRRLAANAEKLSIDISAFDEPSVLALLANAIERDEIIHGRARITFYDESASPIWSDSTDKKTGYSIITGDQRPVPKEFRLTVSPYLVTSTSPLAGVKSCNYLENILAMDEAKGRGFHEAVRVNERGEVTSGCMSNLFWLRDRKLFTPSLLTGCLAGTTREFVLENLECDEIKADKESIETADEIFLTSAGIGVVQVAEIDGRRLQKRPHPILDLLKN